MQAEIKPSLKTLKARAVFSLPKNNFTFFNFYAYLSHLLAVVRRLCYNQDYEKG
jgi:hypothetical protein